MYLNNVLIIISDYKNIIRIYVYIFFEEDETGSAGWMKVFRPTGSIIDRKNSCRIDRAIAC